MERDLERSTTTLYRFIEKHRQRGRLEAAEQALLDECARLHRVASTFDAWNPPGIGMRPCKSFEEQFAAVWQGKSGRDGEQMPGIALKLLVAAVVFERSLDRARQEKLLRGYLGLCQERARCAAYRPMREHARASLQRLDDLAEKAWKAESASRRALAESLEGKLLHLVQLCDELCVKPQDKAARLRVQGLCEAVEESGATLDECRTALAGLSFTIEKKRLRYVETLLKTRFGKTGGASPAETPVRSPDELEFLTDYFADFGMQRERAAEVANVLTLAEAERREAALGAALGSTQAARTVISGRPHLFLASVEVFDQECRELAWRKQQLQTACSAIGVPAADEILSMCPALMLMPLQECGAYLGELTRVGKLILRNGLLAEPQFAAFQQQPARLLPAQLPGLKGEVEAALHERQAKASA